MKGPGKNGLTHGIRFYIRPDFLAHRSPGRVTNAGCSSHWPTFPYLHTFYQLTLACRFLPAVFLKSHYCLCSLSSSLKFVLLPLLLFLFLLSTLHLLSVSPPLYCAFLPILFHPPTLLPRVPSLPHSYSFCSSCHFFPPLLPPFLRSSPLLPLPFTFPSFPSSMCPSYSLSLPLPLFYSLPSELSVKVCLSQPLANPRIL